MDSNASEMKAKLEALAAEIEAKQRQFKEQGVLTDAHQALLANLSARRASAQAKVEAALKGGAGWDAVGAEFQRDYGGMWEEWSRLLEGMDSSAMKGE